MKITDFGFDEHYTANRQEIDWYQSSDKTMEEKQRDIYSAGAVFYHMLTGVPVRFDHGRIQADNLFNNDPYYQQGGDMVRVGGLQYSINPTAKMGKRINDMELNGKAIKANKKYRVAGWASVDRLPEGGKPIWDVVTEYLKQQKRVKISELNIPKIKGVSRNPGFEFG